MLPPRLPPSFEDQVPPLDTGFNAALGRVVSTREAEAWVRALDRLEEGLDRGRLLETCLVRKGGVDENVVYRTRSYTAGLYKQLQLAHPICNLQSLCMAVKLTVLLYYMVAILKRLLGRWD